MRWTDKDTRRLVYMREVERRPWAKIAACFPERSHQSCEVRYWYIHHRMLDAGERFAPDRTAKPQQAAARSPTKSPTSYHALITDRELRSRIETQGITAGLLGDPLPGRSALDKKRPSTIAQ